MKKIFKILLSVMLVTTFTYAELREITPQKLQESISKNIIIVDIRRADEWKATGVIETSHKITFFDESGKYDVNAWVEELEKLVKDKNQPFVLVCRSGNRTGIVGDFLNKKLEYHNVYHLEGGIKAWLGQQRQTIK